MLGDAPVLAYGFPIKTARDAEGEGAYKGGLGAILSIMIGRYFLSSGVALQFIV